MRLLEHCQAGNIFNFHRRDLYTGTLTWHSFSRCSIQLITLLSMLNTGVKMNWPCSVAALAHVSGTPIMYLSQR